MYLFVTLYTWKYLVNRRLSLEFNPRDRRRNIECDLILSIFPNDLPYTLKKVDDLKFFESVNYYLSHLLLYIWFPILIRNI